MAARIKFDLIKKFAQMLNDWAGRTCTKITITEEIDSMGNIVDRTKVETEIVAFIGNPGMNTSPQPVGLMQPGDLCMYAKVADNIVAFEQLTPTTTRRDEIRFMNITYKTELTNQIFDVDEHAIDVFKLKRLSI